MWRSITFLEIQDLILNSDIGMKAFDLFNNQLDDYRGDENNAPYLAMPHVLIEFVGGDWEHDGKVRIAEEYIFRLHLVIEDYQRSHSGSSDQAAALAHLDKISDLANLIDSQTLTYAHNFEFIREEIDRSRTNIIVNMLDFVARVIDCSLEEATAPETVVITQTHEEAYYIIDKGDETEPLVPHPDDMIVFLDPSIGFTPSLWSDQSGNSSDFSQSTPSAQPSQNLTGINGKPSVTMSGATYMELTKLLTTTEITLHIVLKKNGAAVGGYASVIILSALGFSSVGSNFIQINHGVSGGTQYVGNFATGTLDSTITDADSDPKLITIVKTATTVEYRVNGVSIATQSGVQNVTHTEHFIGAWAGKYFNGEIGDIIIYNKPQTTSPLEQTEAFLIDKYSLV